MILLISPTPWLVDFTTHYTIWASCDLHTVNCLIWNNHWNCWLMFENSFHHVPLCFKHPNSSNTLHFAQLLSWRRESPRWNTLCRMGYLLTAAGVEGGVTPDELWELVAMSCISDNVPVSWNAGAPGLPVCKAGYSVSGNIVWKLCRLLEVMYSCMFLSLLWVSNLKWEGSDLGLIIWWVLLRVESSGNLTQ